MLAWLSFTFIDINFTLTSCPASRTRAVVAIQTISANPTIATWHGATLIVICLTIFACPACDTLTFIVINLKKKKLYSLNSANYQCNMTFQYSLLLYQVTYWKKTSHALKW